ncbi:putative solute carrier family 35 member F6 [Skeletonema marinoi]|uniref:Solute carrier family 35 member F6 n=1 Tax=Skeletonema marinoi TaxID=267567 RepID=A0AAD9D3I1_9STRA|nr:putative solute carrier family 35 member F6 [Skeletonema marinoi]
MYSAKVSFILGAMVLTGAARSVTAKLFYQLGFNHPLFLTLLYLIGQALSLIPYNIMAQLKNCGYHLVWDDHAILPRMSKIAAEEEQSVSITIADNAIPDDELERGGIVASLDKSEAKDEEAEEESQRQKFASEDGTNTSSAARASISFADGTKESDGAVIEDQLEDKSASTSLDPVNTSGKMVKKPMAKKPSLLDRAKSARMSAKALDTARRRQIRHQISASTHGLPIHSRTRNCHASIPWYLKPAVPAFFNLLNSAMRWASLVFVAASVAEMLISGMELVLSVCATRLVRGRKITCVRWVGVSVVTLGIIHVGVFDTNNVADGETNDGSTVNKQIIGILLILGQSVMSVIQDLTEEVFMQETAFPPALLVGMEGAYGIVIAIILYFPIAPLLGENPSDVASSLSKDNVIGLAIGWTLLVTVTGIFNIAATAVTSSMTRNVWKNMRTLLVWIMGLILFYATGSSELGEGWYIPGSFFILLSYGVMCVGIFIYYGKGARAT